MILTVTRGDYGASNLATLLQAYEDIGWPKDEARVRSLQDAALAERESLGQHVRAVEDRALKEIDRARQETKELQGRLTAAVRQSAAAEKSLRELIDQANTKAVEASREASAQRARADALEGQLGVLRDLPAALRAAFPQADPGSAARKSRSRSKVAPSKQTKATKQSSQPARRRRAKVAELRVTSWLRSRRQSLGSTDIRELHVLASIT